MRLRELKLGDYKLLYHPFVELRPEYWSHVRTAYFGGLPYFLDMIFPMGQIVIARMSRNLWNEE